MHANQLAYSPGGGRTGVSGSLNCANVPANKYRHVAGTDVFLPQELYVRCFNHRVSRFHRANEAFGFHHAECF
jgi:hypothetical protein